MALSDSVPHSDTVEEDEDLYDCVENEEAEGDEIYEDLMRTEPVPMPVCGGQRAGPRRVHGCGAAQVSQHSPPHSQPKMTEYDKRCCCLREIQQTEEKYTDTLGSIQHVRCSHSAPTRRMRGSMAGRAFTCPAASGAKLRDSTCPKTAWDSSLSPLLCVSLSLFISIFLSFPGLSLLPLIVFLSMCLFIPVCILSCILVSACLCNCL